MVFSNTESDAEAVHSRNIVLPEQVCVRCRRRTRPFKTSRFWAPAGRCNVCTRKLLVQSRNEAPTRKCRLAVPRELFPGARRPGRLEQVAFWRSPEGCEVWVAGQNRVRVQAERGVEETQPAGALLPGPRDLHPPSWRQQEATAVAGGGLGSPVS